MGANEAQQDEMTALESILEPSAFTFSSSDQLISGQLLVSVQVPEDFYVKETDGTKHPLHYFPPLVLHFTLPFAYPEGAQPIYTLTATWLDRGLLSILCQKLDSIYQEHNSEILYTWYSFLKQETLGTLELKEYAIASLAHKQPAVKRDARAVFDPRPEPMLEHLLNHNSEERDRIFNSTSHPCPICMTERMGVDCIKLSCDHAFCLNCVKGYWTGLITEGSVEGVKCLSYKCTQEPTPLQVKSAVGEELYSRYDSLVLARTLDNMSDIMYCPIRSCHCAVLSDPNDKLATCSRCHYVFCSACKSGYHGVEPCRFKAEEKNEVYVKYTTGNENERKQLEKLYGKKQLTLLVDTVLSESWVNSRSKPCPHCNVPIEKFEGCNKVTCFKCNTYFCWICQKNLDTKNPYSHFNDPSSPCYNRLFLGADDDEEEEGEDNDSDFSDALDTSSESDE